MEWRLLDYMVSTRYLEPDMWSTQRPCTGLRWMLVPMAVIYASWIDLENAYGSVKHSLVHFSLEWYHVHEHFCELM